FTYSSNIIKDGKFYLGAANLIDLSGNKISGFPEILSNFGISYSKSGLIAKLNGKYVGAFYSDNYDGKLENYLAANPGFVSYTDNKNDAYFTADFFVSYETNILKALGNTKIFFQVNNIFDNLYSAYAIGGEFFPAAERNFLAGLQVEL
ncbi:MAG: TonB-dependent receptor, partial [Ignavibacteriaceae bacterium]|nr:TonB-dependent receptor [Ignavibacteriaceae bacterium]